MLSAALASSLGVAAALALIGATGWGGFPVLMGLLFLNLAVAGVISPNIAAVVMAPFGDVAGSASALLGTIQFGVGAVAGALVGLCHDGTARPMTFGIAACALASLIVWRWSGRKGAIKGRSATRG